MNELPTTCTAPQTPAVMWFHQDSLSLCLHPGPLQPTLHRQSKGFLQKLSQVVPPLLKSSKGSHLTRNNVQSPQDGPQALHNLPTRLPAPTVTSPPSPRTRSPSPVPLASLVPKTRSCLGAFARAVPCASHALPTEER